MKKITLLISLFSSISFASGNSEITDNIAAKLKLIHAEKFDNVRVQPSLMDGYYQVLFKNGTKIYVDKDVTKVISGNLIKVEDNQLLNITEQENRIRNSKIIADLATKYKETLVHYPAKKEKITTLYVFSDFTCPYCKKFHNELNQLTASGVEVYYIPFPKASMSDTRVVKGLQRIICENDKQKAFDEAFANPKKYALDSMSMDMKCSQAVDILAFHNYADLLGVNGTPTMYTDKGSKIVGFNDIQSFGLELRMALEGEAGWKDKDLK